MGKAKTPDETEQERALAEIAAQRFNRYKEVFAPLEDQYIQQVFDVRNQDNYETAGGLAAAEYQRSFQKSQNDLSGQMMQQGVDPSSGAYEGNSAALRRAQAVGQGLGVSGAKIANTDRFYQGLKGITAIGQGQAADAITGMGDIAKTARENANRDAGNAFDSSGMIRSGVAAGLGYAAAPYVDSKVKRPTAPKTTFSGVTSGMGGG